MEPFIPALIPTDRFEVFASNIDHPECVAFDRDGNLWAGGEAGQVYRTDPRGKAEQIAILGSFNGGLAFSPADELLVCNPAMGLVKVDRSGKHAVFATHASGAKLIGPNFPVFDSKGNVYVTDSGDWSKHNGRLCRFAATGTGEILIADLGYTNGLALSADERTLFMIESDTDRVFRVDLTTMKHEVFATDVGRLPDGLALDADQNLYVSCYASDDIHRISPAGERTLFAYDRWAILISRPTNIAFHDDYIYLANLGRTAITRAKVNIRGQPLANRR